MRTLSADIKDIKVRELIEAARKEPLTVLENATPRLASARQSQRCSKRPPTEG